MTFRPSVVEMMDPMMIEVLRKKTPQERLAIASGMWESARAIIRGAVRQQHPDWSEEQINQEIARRVSHGRVEPGVVNDAEC
jgi:hypothetical protein